MDTIKQARKSKKEAVKVAKLQLHKVKIVKDLFTSNGLEVPETLYGNAAKDFVKENAINGERLLSNKPNGLFIREFKEGSKVSEKDRRIGVVCMFKSRVSTLAHELRHAYQWQIDKSMFPNTNEEKALYEKYTDAYFKKDYYNVPAEKDAFTYAMQYLNTDSGLFRGFFKRWSYRWQILSLNLSFKRYILTLSLFSIVLITIFKLAIALWSISMIPGIIAVIIVVVAWLLSHGVCRILMDKENFRKLK